MLLDNYKKESPIIGVAGMGGGINSYIFLSSGDDSPYVISRSLRFNPGDSAHLSRTPSSAGNRRTWTWSAWVKRSGLGYFQYLFDCDSGSSPEETPIRFWSDDRLNISAYTTSSQYNLTTTAKFRDTSAWYHIVVAFDTTNTTPDDRIKLYVNGVQITQFDVRANPSENTDYYINSAIEHNIGRAGSGNFRYLGGYLADVNFIDGQALAPTSFGKTDSAGIWQPKKYSGTHGQNGFHLDFKDNSGTTATTLGKDNSGNSNNWTPNYISVSAGSGNDSLLDTPSQIEEQTDSGAGGTVKGNYATFNSLYGSGTKSNGSLVTTTGGYVPDISSIAPSSGKWYAEITWVSGSYARIGVQDISEYVTDFGENIYGWRYESNTGNLHNGSVLSSGSSYGTGTTVGIAMDLDAGKLWVSKNNVWQNSGNPSTGANPSASNLPVGHPIAFACASGSGSSVFSVNFGQRAFAYNAPTNFKSLNSANLSPTGPAAEPNKYFDTRSSLLAGGSNDRWTISDLNFSTDLSVSKSTSNDEYWVWTDSVRGFDKVLKSDETDQEGSGTAITNVSATGFSATNNWFTTGRTYATFNWDAGTSSNTTVAVAGKNTSEYNESTDWTSGANNANMQNAWSASFDGNTSNFALPNTGYSASLTFSSAISYTTLELVVTRDSSAPDLLMNGSALNVPSTNTSSNGGEYKIEYFNFTNGTLTSIGHQTRNIAGQGGSGFYQIIVDGKILVNSGVTPPNAPTIASTLRANPEAGFSIVTYSGGGSGSANSDSGQSFAHGLNSRPDLVIVKKRTGANGWPVYHSSTPIGALSLNGITALDTSSWLFAKKSPSNNVVFLGNNPEINATGDDYVAYCFSQILGYSSMGKYTGTGNDDGRFIYTGFRPRLIFTKAYSSNSNNNNGWCIHDASIDPNNESSSKLAFENDDPILNNSHTGIDILSNGFKLKADTNGQSNYSGWDYVYYAVAENPFKSARAR